MHGDSKRAAREVQGWAIAGAYARVLDALVAQGAEVSFGTRWDGLPTIGSVDGENVPLEIRFSDYGLLATLGEYGEKACVPEGRKGLNHAKIAKRMIERAAATKVRRARAAEEGKRSGELQAAAQQIRAASHERLQVQASPYGVCVMLNNVPPELAAKVAAAMSAILAEGGAR